MAERFLAAVQDSQVTAPALNLFISQDAQDILAQAAAATDRYQQGISLVQSFKYSTYSRCSLLVAVAI